MIKFTSFLYMLFYEPFLVVTMLLSGAKWHKWPRWKFLYIEALKCKNILEIGGGLSTLVLSRAMKRTGGQIRTVEQSGFWKNFINSRLSWDNVVFIDSPFFDDADLIFIDTEFEISNPKFYKIIVDNRKNLCDRMNLKFNPYIRIGTNI